MYGHDTLFLYFTRRARQEQVAAINASNPAAEAAHQSLSCLHAARALLAVVNAPEPDLRASAAGEAVARLAEAA
jgi:hypothetical protein